MKTTPNVLTRADAPRADWLVARRRGLGGSDAATVVGLNRYSTRWQLWLDKTGRAEDWEGNTKTRAGQRIEPILRRWFTEDTGIRVRRAGLLQHPGPDMGWMLVSPDGLTSDGGMIEIKNVGHYRAQAEWEDGPADYAVCQAQWGLAVTGRTHAYIIALVDGWDFRVTKIDRDPELLEFMVSEASTFWHDHVLTDTPPEVTAGDLERLKTHFPRAVRDKIVSEDAAILAIDYDTCRTRAKAAEEQLDAAKARMLAVMGDHDTLTDPHGKTWATLKNRETSRLDVTRLRQDHPDLAEEYTRKSQSRTLRVPDPDKNAG